MVNLQVKLFSDDLKPGSREQFGERGNQGQNIT